MPNHDKDRIRRNVQKMVAAGAPDEEIRDYLENVEGLASSGESDPPGGLGGVASRAGERISAMFDPTESKGASAVIRQGLVPGWADNITAALKSVPAFVPGGESPTEAYRRNLASENEALNRHRTLHPGRSAIAEAGAGLAAGTSLVRAAPALTSVGANAGRVGRAATAPVRAVGRAANLESSPSFGKVLMASTGIGAAAGAGENEENRLEGAVDGGKWGALAALGLGVGATATKHLVRPVASAVVDAVPGLRPTARPRASDLPAGTEYRYTGGGSAPEGVSTGPEAVVDALRRNARGLSASRTVTDSGIASNEERALEMALTDASRARMSLDDIEQRVAGADDTETLMEILGQPGQRRARGAHSIPSTGSADLEKFVDERMAGQEERLLDALEQHTGQGRKSIRGTIHQMSDERAAEAEELYGPLRDRVVADPSIAAALKRPAFQKAYQRAVDIRENEIAEAMLQGKEPPAALPPIDQLSQGPLPHLTLEVLDQVKRGLDDVIYSSKREGLGKQQIGSLEGVRRAFVKALDGAVPEYAQARSAFAGKSAMIEAMEKGRDVFLSRAGQPALRLEELREMIADMGESELDAFRKGAVESLAQSIEGVDEMWDATRRGGLRNNTLARQKLRLLFDNDEAADGFLDVVEREGAKAASRGVVKGGSPTARIDAEQNEMLAGVAKDAATGGAAGIVGALRGLAYNKAMDAGLTRGMEARADAIAPVMTATGDDLKALVQALREFQERQARGEARRTAGRVGVAGVAGMYGGR